MEAYLEDLEAGEASVSAYYGLTTQGYENLSNNIRFAERLRRKLYNMVADFDDDADGINDSDDVGPLDDSRPPPFVWDAGNWGDLKWQ